MTTISNILEKSRTLFKKNDVESIAIEDISTELIVLYQPVSKIVLFFDLVLKNDCHNVVKKVNKEIIEAEKNVGIYQGELITNPFARRLIFSNVQIFNKQFFTIKEFLSPYLKMELCLYQIKDSTYR